MHSATHRLTLLNLSFSPSAGGKSGGVGIPFHIQQRFLAEAEQTD